MFKLTNLIFFDFFLMKCLTFGFFWNIILVTLYQKHFYSMFLLRIFGLRFWPRIEKIELFILTLTSLIVCFLSHLNFTIFDGKSQCFFVPFRKSVVFFSLSSIMLYVKLPWGFFHKTHSFV